MEPGPQLFVSIEALPGEATLARLRAALTASAISSVLLTPGEASGGAIDAAGVAPLVALIQAHNAAALIEDDAALARTLNADGVHLTPRDDVEEAYVSAREILGQDRIVGAVITGSRHDAMSLAEMGADYIAFAGPERDGLVVWWAEMFVVPCVALGVATEAEAQGLAQNGVDFIGLQISAAVPVDEIQAHVQAIAGCLARDGAAAGLRGRAAS